MQNKSSSINGRSDRVILRFLGFVFVGGTITQVVAIRAGVRDHGTGWLLLTMWMPALAAFTASRTTRQMAWASLRRPSLGWLGLGLLTGWAPGLLKAVMLAVSGTGSWDGAHFELAPDGRSIQAVHHLGLVLGTGLQSFGRFVLNLLLSITLGSVVAALFGGVGEELGWRAVLQPLLERRCSRLTATCLVGLIWAYWHLPVNLAGYNDAVHPALTAWLFFPLGVVAISFGFVWLTRESKSVWPAALAHGANNALGAGFLVRARGWRADTGAELVALGLVGGFCLAHAAERQQSQRRRGRCARQDARHRWRDACPTREVRSGVFPAVAAVCDR